MLLQLSHFFLPFIFLHPLPLLPPRSFPHLSSCPWVTHLSSFASPFPILFLTSPCLLCTYPVMLLNPCTFFPILPLPTDYPPYDLHFCDSVPVPIVCLVFVFVDSCEFIILLLFIVLIFFFMDGSL